MITAELRPFAPPQTKAQTWLLPGLLPRGELVLLEGAASVGKSLLAAAFAARVSQDDACTLLTASPSSSEVLAVHLAHQEPQFDKLRELVWYADRDGKQDFAAEESLTKLQNHLEQHQPPLLVLDSLEESLAILAGEKERKLREFWSQLVALARQHGTTILVLARPQGRRGTARVARTAAGAARAVFTLAWHPTDPTQRVLTRTRDLTAPAGAQWHVTLDPDGRADWTEAAPADHVAPAGALSTWNHDARQRPDLAGAVRIIEDALVSPLPGMVLRDLVVRQGHTAHTYRTAMTLVDVEYKKLGHIWVYYPGPELSALQKLRRQPAASPAREPAPAPPPLPTEQLALRRQVNAKLNAMHSAFVAEVGPEAADHFIKTYQPPALADRYLQATNAIVAQFTPEERAIYNVIVQEAERRAEDRLQQGASCCARAHAATS
jgi:hypothetical protein